MGVLFMFNAKKLVLSLIVLGSVVAQPALAAPGDRPGRGDARPEVRGDLRDERRDDRGESRRDDRQDDRRADEQRRDDERDQRRSDAIVAGVVGGVVGLIAADVFDRNDRDGWDRGPGRGGPGRGDGWDRGPGRGPGRGDGWDRGPGRGPGRGDGWDRGPGRGPGHGYPPPRPRPVICYAQNARGQIYQGRGRNAREAQNNALDACYSFSRRCAPAGCQR